MSEVIAASRLTKVIFSHIGHPLKNVAPMVTARFVVQQVRSFKVATVYLLRVVVGEGSGFWMSGSGCALSGRFEECFYRAEEVCSRHDEV